MAACVNEAAQKWRSAENWIKQATPKGAAEFCMKMNVVDVGSEVSIESCMVSKNLLNQVFQIGKIDMSPSVLRRQLTKSTFLSVMCTVTRRCSDFFCWN